MISGKVREVYDLEDGRLVIVTTDRISAFDVILPTPIPGKGSVLNRLSQFWFDKTADIVPNHTLPGEPPPPFDAPEYRGRAVAVKKLTMLPYEFIVRGYMFGSMWKEYQQTEGFRGYPLPRGLRQAERLPAPLLTPSTKSSEGHDVNIGMDELSQGLGAEQAARLEQACLQVYARCYDYALTKGVIIADTKMEFGLDETGALTLADELLTPDSSRFWNAESYTVGTSPKSYDKQFVRDWLIQNKLDGVTPPPEIPADIAQATADIYGECLARLTAEN
ncbi:MAG: phosphoribosylaminoimidazolesuccinocarboxamide synthase [Oscillospiraceae bacterium]|jgi:phosphoribosylaminoimidazole-succinocarboxamide synthase|nr:phosphoribosylaminoimidazolesuccinocarboxamide synthase [Oscillospiraceae bacterium]